MNILILDDDDARHHAFKSHLLVSHCLTHVHTYQEFVDAITNNTYDVIFLDHDLNYEGYISKSANGRELTGYDCALFLIKNGTILNQSAHIVIHSHNEGGTMHMNGVLRSSGILPIVWPFSPSQHPLDAAGIEVKD